MKSKTFKKLTAMMIAVMLVFSMCVTGISASAAAVSAVKISFKNDRIFIEYMSFSTEEKRNIFPYLWKK